MIQKNNRNTKERLKFIVIYALFERNIYELSADFIAKRAGIKKSSLFHHFSTMDELFSESLSLGLSLKHDIDNHKLYNRVEGMLTGCIIFPQTILTVSKFEKFKR